jgi:hypothetical protein
VDARQAQHERASMPRAPGTGKGRPQTSTA